MKKVILIFLMTGIVTIVMAQATKTVKGAVIDINGNPIPGAKVEATGGAENTVTDADGTFSLEVSQWLKSLSVTYPGMDKNKMSIKNDNRDLIFTMKETNRYGFVNAVVQYNAQSIGAGVMFGQLKKWGWYGKAVMDFTNIEGNHDESSYGPALSAGVIKSVTKSNYLYFGVGYANLYHSDEHWHEVYRYDEYGYYYYDYYFDGDEWENKRAALFELGAIHRFGHFNLNYGVGVITDFDDDIDMSFNLGIGFSF